MKGVMSGVRLLLVEECRYRRLGLCRRPDVEDDCLVRRDGADGEDRAEAVCLRLVVLLPAVFLRRLRDL